MYDDSRCMNKYVNLNLIQLLDGLDTILPELICCTVVAGVNFNLFIDRS